MPDFRYKRKRKLRRFRRRQHVVRWVGRARFEEGKEVETTNSCPSAAQKSCFYMVINEGLILQIRYRLYFQLKAHRPETICALLWVDTRCVGKYICLPFMFWLGCWLSGMNILKCNVVTIHFTLFCSHLVVCSVFCWVKCGYDSCPIAAYYSTIVRRRKSWKRPEIGHITSKKGHCVYSCATLIILLISHFYLCCITYWLLIEEAICFTQTHIPVPWWEAVLYNIVHLVCYNLLQSTLKSP